PFSISTQREAPAIFFRLRCDGGTAFARAIGVKVRIKRTPREEELDGVRLDRLQPGAVRDLQSDLATWLVAERYADVEMRRTVQSYDEDFSSVKDNPSLPSDPDPPRRRSGD